MFYLVTYFIVRLHYYRSYHFKFFEVSFYISLFQAYVKHKDSTKVPSKEQWNNESSSKQITQMKNIFRNAIDSRKKDFKKLNHNFGENFRCYCVLENRKNRQSINHSLNGYFLTYMCGFITQELLTALKVCRLFRAKH